MNKSKGRLYYRPMYTTITIIVLDLLLAIGFCWYGIKQRSHDADVRIQWNPCSELFLILFVPMAGELFGCFFLTKWYLVLLTGFIMMFFSVTGSMMRLKTLQKEVNEDKKIAKQNQKALFFLCIGAALLLCLIFYLQFRHIIIIPRFRGIK